MMLRPLGALEYTYWMMSLATHTNFVVTCSLSGPVDHQSLSDALDTVQKAYPLLNVCIIPDKHHGAVFEKIPEIKIALSVEHLSNQSILTESEYFIFDTPLIRRIETEQRFDFNKSRSPLMRCLLLRHSKNDSTLILTFHHSIADALSAFNVTRSLIEVLASTPNGKPYIIQPVKAPEPFEKFIPNRHSGLTAFGQFLLYTFRQTLSRIIPGAMHVPIDKKKLPHERHERFIASVFDNDCTKRIITASRQQNCTVHSILCAAQLHALKEEYPSKHSIHAWLLSLVDCRQHFNKTYNSENLNLMISIVESLYRVTATKSLWDLAREIHYSTKSLINNEFHYVHFPTMTRILHATRFLYRPNYSGSKQMLKQGQSSRPQVLAVSNIGRTNIPTDFGSIHCKTISYFMPLSSSGLFGSSINTFNEKLYWNFSYAYPAVSQERAVRLAQRSREIISGETNSFKSTKQVF